MRGATSARHSDFAVSPFQSTRPVRGATHVDAAMKRVDTLFQSTRPVRGATYEALKDGKVSMFQSTRPVRGATGEFAPSEERAQSFNPRAPCGAPRAGRDGGSGANAAHMSKFQSTRPVRGATPEPSLPRTRLSFQSTRPVRGATCSIPSRIFWLEFQSTRPVRGATWT